MRDGYFDKQPEPVISPTTNYLIFNGDQQFAVNTTTSILYWIDEHVAGVDNVGVVVGST